MRSKNIIFSFLMIILALLLVSTASASDNDTVLDANSPQALSDYPDLVFEQSYDPKIVYKDSLFEVYLSVRNTGQNSYQNVSIYYPFPDGLELVIWPSEYNNPIWFIDTIYPGERNTLTLICIPKIANTTYDFPAIVDGQTVTDVEIYCEDVPGPEPGPGPGPGPEPGPGPGPEPGPGPGPDPHVDPSHHGGAIDIVKSVGENGLSLKEAGNPIFLLLFIIIFVPYIRLKY